MKKYARKAVHNIRSITLKFREPRTIKKRGVILFSVMALIFGASMPPSLASQAEIDAMSAAAKNMYLPVGTSLDSEITNTILPLLSGGGNTFTDINYGGGNGWDQVQHLERATKMAQAYQDPASAHYQDAALHDSILALLDYFINNWPYEPSWWWAAIGYPNNCNPVVMLMKDEIIASSTYPNLQNQTDNQLTSKSWDKRGNSGGGANDSDICTSALAAALLSDDYGYCTSVKNYCNPLFSLKTGYSDGLMSDSSFTQHNGNGRQFQLTSYGREYMGGFLELATVFKPSSLKFSDAVIGSFEDLYLSGVRHLVYHANGPGTHWQDPGYMDILQSGRGYPSGGWIDRGLAEFNMSYNIPEFLAYGAPRSKELQQLQDILTDVVQETVPANKMFWHQDMMTHQRQHYYTSARGTSTRTVGNEGRISEAAKSYHMGDGVNMVLHHGDEYDGIYAPWDWKRLPGTTIEQNGSALPANSTLLQWPGGEDHAGGVSDGTYGNYGFYFNEGGNNSKMEAYKSQFFFDDEYVCLGAGIKASGAGSDVVTTINQTMHKSDFVKGDGASTSTYGAGGSVTLDNNQWVHHYDIGYLILDKDGTATASVDSQTGLKSDINGGTSYNPDSITANIFNLTINHGSGTYTGKKYAYVVVPGLSVSEMDAYAAAPGVEVLSNSTTVQAVHHAGLRITSAHFYSAGSLTMKDGTILTTDKAVALLLKEEGSFLVISAADPKYQGTTTTITLDKELSGTGVTWNGSVSTIPITLAGGGHDNGKSVSIAVVDESTGGPNDGELLNGSFQSGDTAGWDVTWNGQNLKKSMHAFDGSYALSIQHGAALNQFVNVQPNTQYALTYAIETTDGTDMVIGVNDAADAQLAVATETNGTYQSKRMLFTTGAADTTVKVWLWHPGNQGSDAVAYIDSIALSKDDYTAPTPVAGFVAAPAAISGTMISMTSVTGIDDAPPVEYYFTETTGNPGGDDSGWQTSPVYTDSGLDPLTTYSYTVTMRDAWGNQGTASAVESATTPVPTPLISWDGSGSTTPVNGVLNISGQIFASAGVETSRGSSDGWFGPDNMNDGGLSGADTTTATGYKLSGSTSLDLRFTNDSGPDFDLVSLVFDYMSIWATGPQKLELWYSYGDLDDLDNTLLVTLDAPGYSGGSGAYDYPDFHVNLQAVLSDYTLSAGQSATFTIKGIDFTNGGVNGVIDNIAFLDTFPAAGPDVDPPLPNPASFSVAPTAISTSEISMTSTAGSDVSGPVEYLFTETSGNPGGTDSGWQASPVYTDDGLNELTEYTYTVTLRDSLGNTGTASAGQSATTPSSVDSVPPEPNPMSWAIAPTAGADLLAVYEGFEYPAGGVIGGNGGVGFAGDWTTLKNSETAGNYYIDSVGLSFSDAFSNVLPVSGNSALRTDAAGRSEAHRFLSSSARNTLLADGSTMWFSVLHTRTTTNEHAGFVIGSGTFNPASGWELKEYTTGAEGFGFGSSNSQWIVAAGYDPANGLTQVDTSVDAMSTRLLVGRIDWNVVGTDDVMSLYNVSDLGAEPVTPLATVSLDLDQANFDNISIMANKDGSRFDEIRIGTSYASVVGAVDNADSISMSAAVASDISGVEYYFAETSGNPGGDDSGWQDSPDYVDIGLQPATEYTYTVIARDKSVNQNMTAASTAASATTLGDAVDIAPPMPDPASFAVVPSALSDTMVSMTATVGTDNSGVEYLFTETSGNPGGASSGWQAGPSYTNSGLSALTEYTYTVTMRDSLGNTGNASAGLSVTTLAPPDVDPPLPDPASFAIVPTAVSDSEISMTATTGSDASGPVEYYFAETSGNPGGTDSGWQTSPVYSDDGLSELTEYAYTVTLRDALGNTGSTSAPTIATTLAMNLIPNGGFESGLTGWNLWNSPGIVPDAYEGSSALQMTDSGSAGQWIDVLPSTTYRLSAYMKTSMSTNRVVLGTNGDSSAGGVDTYSTTYTLVEKVFTTDVDTTQIEVYCWQPPSGGALATVDDMRLERVLGGGDITPPAAPAGVSALAGIGNVALDWADSGEPDLASYTVYRSTTSGNGHSVVATGLVSSDYVDNGVSDHTAYYYVVTAVDLSGNESSLSSEVSAQPGFVPDLPSSDIAVEGTVSGSLNDAELSDDTYQTIVEVNNGSTSTLEHKWVFHVTGAELVTFYIEAHGSSNTEGDEFIFSYSTNDVDYIDMVIVSKTVDDDVYQYYSLPSGLSGIVYVRVVDADQTAGNNQLDSISVDSILIVSEESSVAPVGASNPVPMDGAVDVALDADLSWTAGMMSASHDVYFGTDPSPAFMGNLADTLFDPGTLLNATTYYWAADAVNNSGTTAGPVWSFTTVAANSPPVWGDLNYPDGEAGVAYVGWTAWRVTDAEGDSLTFAKVSGPAWIDVATSDGKLTGTPGASDVGINTLVLSVSDGVNAPVEATVLITVNGGGATVVLFTDGFESSSFDTGGWSKQNGDAKIGNKANTGVKGAELKKSTWIETAVSTVGHTDIHFKYARYTEKYDSGEVLSVEWYDGSSWHVVETTQDTAWTSQDIALGAGASNNAGFKIRFLTNANDKKEKAFIDDVEITGVN